MAQLEPCPACTRHIRVDESTCPFCGAQVTTTFAALKARALPRTRLGRAALFAFGVSAAAAVMPGCSDDDDDDGGKDTDGGAANQDAGGNPQPVYGAPSLDAGVEPPQEDGGGLNNQPDAGGVVALYGAAPTD